MMRIFITLSVLSLFFSTLLFAEAPKITSSMTMLELNKLTAFDAAANDRFGYSVAISGDTAIVGAHGDGDSGLYSGSAYIFERNPETSLFEQIAKLTASDGAAEDNFGRPVSISSDTVIVGAYGNNDAGDSSGSAYIFEKPALGWGNATETAKLTASDAAAEDNFGRSVAISGDTVIVGAHGDNSGTGSAYIFEKLAEGWGNVMTETAKLNASDGAQWDGFGMRVAISGDTLIVGADDADSRTGSAYVFVKPGASWSNMTETAKLTASDRAQNDIFGISVAISGDTVIVGAQGDDDVGYDSGSAYLFEKPDSGWVNATENAKLNASDGARIDLFGTSVAISGDMIIVGAHYNDGTASSSGSAYFFQKPVSGWVTATETSKMNVFDGAQDDWFGYSVAISGNTVIVGAYGNDDAGSNSGSAYLFEPTLTQNSIENKTEILDIEASDAEGDTITFAIIEGADAAHFTINAASGLLSFKTAPDYESPVDADGDNIYEAILELSDVFESNTFKLLIKVSDLEYEGEPPEALSFKELNKLTASDPAASVGFGYSVAISGSVAIIGAPSAGAAYIYEYQSNSDTLIQQAHLSASDAIPDNYFGTSVAINGDTVIVGATGDRCINADMYCGSVYLFEKPSGGWTDMTQSTKLTASDRATFDFFGKSVAVSTDTVVVGAYTDDCVDDSNDCGSVYVFEKPALGWATTTEDAKLRASDGIKSDYFGRSVAISGDTIIIGANGDDDAGTDSGSAYLFEKPASGWATSTKSIKLTASDNTTYDNFGLSVAISGDTVIVGAWSNDSIGFNSGSAYVFEKPVSGWAIATENAKLTASDGMAYDIFGWSVAISGATIIVGTYKDDCVDDSIDCGSAYLFEKPDSGWATATESKKLTASDGISGDNFGFSVAISGDTAIAGTYIDNGLSSGSAYVFKVKNQGVNPGVIMYLLD
ncbi:MAG: hypothetical protein GQ546_09135 [Gammaproteobacteria bacterium]|nr:hypothetical protein [Gammaproteobacteria bacterium]